MANDKDWGEKDDDWAWWAWDKDADWGEKDKDDGADGNNCLLYTSPSPRDPT